MTSETHYAELSKRVDALTELCTAQAAQMKLLGSLLSANREKLLMEALRTDDGELIDNMVAAGLSFGDLAVSIDGSQANGRPLATLWHDLLGRQKLAAFDALARHGIIPLLGDSDMPSIVFVALDGNVAAAKYLLSKAEVDPNATTLGGLTALHLLPLLKDLKAGLAVAEALLADPRTRLDSEASFAGRPSPAQMAFVLDNIPLYNLYRKAEEAAGTVSDVTSLLEDYKYKEDCREMLGETLADILKLVEPPGLAVSRMVEITPENADEILGHLRAMLRRRG